MKFCSYCGAELQDGAEICKNCGCRAVNAPVKSSASKSGLNVLALVGFILSIVSLLVSLCLLVFEYDSAHTSALFSGMPIAIAGLVCSIVGLVNIKRNQQRGKGFALTGIILAAAIIALWILALLIGLYFVGLLFLLIIAIFGAV